MSFDKVEVRVFSGPDQVQVGSNTEPDLIVMNIGPKGDTGPNSVTSVTTSDGTATLSIADLEVVGGEIYTDGEYSHIYTQGDGAEIFTIGTDAIIYTQGADAHISTSGDSATIYTSGASGSIYTTGANAGISTAGANATMGTQGANATISTTGSAAHIQTTHASAAVKSTNFAAVDSGGASLVDGSFQPCLTWSAGGRNLTIPSGTATTFNTTSYTFGTGAASAFVTALGTFNSSTATALQNSRNIFGIAFNGTANVAGDATNTGHFASIPTGGQAGHFVTLNGTAPTVITGRSAWWSNGSGNPSFRNGTGTAVTLVKSSDLGTNVATFLETPTSANLASALTDENGTGGGFVRAEGATLTSPALVGPVNLTSQDSSTADRVMTRDLSESNHMRNVGIVREIHPACMSFTSASGGSAIVNVDGGFALANPVTANAYSRAALVRAWANYPASTGANNPCNVPVAFAMCGMLLPPFDVNAVVRFVIGEVGSGTPALPSANALSARGFGFEIYWNTTNSRAEIRMFSHDGTSYTTSSTSIAYNASLGRHFSAMVTSDGSGVSKLFYDTSAAGTAPPRVPLTAAITHTAPSSLNYGQPFASVYCVNTSTATTAAYGVRFFSSRLQVGTIY